MQPSAAFPIRHRSASDKGIAKRGMDSTRFKPRIGHTIDEIGHAAEAVQMGVLDTVNDVVKPPPIHGLLVVFACLIVAGCSSPSSTGFSPFTPGPAPTIYSGTLVDSSSGNGTLTISLTNAAGLTGGTWAMSFGGRADPVRLISGTVSDSNYVATIKDCQETGVMSCVPNCRFSFTGSFTSSSLGGTYTAVSDRLCPVRRGSISATKQ
jgi:hypothetical protein